jgi:ferredoxin
MRWGVVLCTCNAALPLDPRRLQGALGLASPPALFARLPRDELTGLAEWAGRERPERTLVACCGRPELFHEALAAGGADAARAVVVNLRDQAFRPHGRGPDAEAKAARLLRAAMWAAEAGQPPPDRPLRVGPTVLIAADGPAGFHLARRLDGVARPSLVLDERSTAFDAEPASALPWRVDWGRVTRIEGHLGAFRVTVERTQPLSLEACIHCGRCVPVCHTAAISVGLRLLTERCDRCGDCLDACGRVGAIRIPREERETVTVHQVVLLGADEPPPAPHRTGLHVLPSGDPGALDSAAWDVLGLIGEFRKAEHVAYDAATCAGGTAGHLACGRCIPACPYDAIARDAREPLRIAVDQPACEGCGACVAVCPTSSLTFTDPGPGELRARLGGLLAPLTGERAELRAVVAFHCPERGRRVLEESARLALPYPASVLPVPMACLRHVSEADILGAFRLGAAGVALVGCAECPHGPRAELLERIDRVEAVLEAFGAGRERLAIVTDAGAEPRAPVEALARFAAALGPAPVRWSGRGTLPREAREVVAEAVRALLDATRREPGAVQVPVDAPFAVPRVDADKCTLARACVNVCPTHAWRFDDQRQSLELRAIACVNCGLCVKACPEGAISLGAALPLEARALDYQVQVRDEPVVCRRCGKPFGNRRAVLAVEARLGALGDVLDAFAGPRRDLLWMCPDCRAVAAMLEMERGWEP